MQSYDSSDDEQIGDLVQNKKSTARRSLESQFSAASGKEQPLLCLDIEENVPLRSEVQVSRCYHTGYCYKQLHILNGENVVINCRHGMI